MLTSITEKYKVVQVYLHVTIFSFYSKTFHFMRTILVQNIEKDLASLWKWSERCVERATK